MTALLLLAALSNPADACDGKKSTASASTEATTEVSAEAVALASTAKKAELIKGNCSYSTGSMAQKVVVSGEDFSYTGSLQPFANNLSSHVACPFTVAANSPDTQTYVIATELVEQLTQEGLLEADLTLEGKAMTVDGVRYVVLTSYRKANA